eukprot:CAMPEP_0194378158 /NCGR_PEP_ID=MMETSP0174-20130528/34406_1 /TAXON_ID=216777 /ORGANISM="Proboscia alata, Strain PI-D3" /LENGTH=314 /DNA_ID=CAMNT_0039159983 /DNA_START=32 /DNA_END=976 /DNA_ORIENTATION=+
MFGYNLCQSGLTLRSITQQDMEFLDSPTGITLTQTHQKTPFDPIAARRHTFGLLNETSNEEWEDIRKKTIRASWYANPKNPLDDVDNPGLWNEKNMLPNFHCPKKEMVPKRQKGEVKYVCNPQRLSYDGKEDSCLIYSFGCAGDFSFEDEIFHMHNKTCEIHIFDPAKWGRKNDIPNKNIHYHAWGLKSTYDNSKSIVWPKGRGGGFKTFPETLELLGHRNRTIDILKMDCEGCEWSTVQDWIHLNIRQILVEMHGVPNPKGTPKARWYQKRMNLNEYYGLYKESGYSLFSKEQNGKLSLELSFMKMTEDFWKR